MKVVCVLIALCLIIHSMDAQNKKSSSKTNSERSVDTTQVDDDLARTASIRALSRNGVDSIVIRWAPTKAGAWFTYNTIGYVVERGDVSNDEAKNVTRFQVINKQTIKAWTLDEFKSRINSTHKYAAIAAQCLYGKVSIPQPGSDGSVNSLALAAQELDNKFAFAMYAADNDILAAEALGLRFVDRNIQRGHEYVYRIRSVRQSERYLIDTAYVSAKAEAAEALMPPMNLSATEEHGQVTLRWKNIPVLPYSGFNVYRRDAQGKEILLNSTPISAVQNPKFNQTMEPYYVDTTCGFYAKHSYFVRGISAFAELSQASSVEAMGRDRSAPPTPVMKKPLIFSNTMVRLEWEMRAEAKDLAGFVVLRSDSVASRFKALHDKLVPAKTFTFLDTAATAAEPYYAVQAVDTAGNVSDYFTAYVDIHDTLPPAMPRGLHGSIDTNGVVRLVWNLGTEKDLLGYRVLWANDTTHEFTQRTNFVLQDTIMVDTIQINTLTPYIYYKVVAVDTRYFHSLATPILALKRPDVVPPQAPQFIDVRVSDSTVILRWARSRSHDLKNHILFKRAQGSKEWKELVRLGAMDQMYEDKTVNKRSTYEYQLVAIDSTGLRSEPSAAVQGRPFDTGKRPSPSNIRLSYDPKTKSVTVQWEFNAMMSEKYWFVLYRGFEDFDLKQMQAIDARQLSVTDKDLVGNGRYRYAVKVMSPYGESPLSEIQEIIVR